MSRNMSHPPQNEKRKMENKEINAKIKPKQTNKIKTIESCKMSNVIGTYAQRLNHTKTNHAECPINV